MVAKAEPAPGAGWRLWALLPVLLLALLVGLFVWTGDSIVDLVGRNPPPADEFDIRRVEFQPGEIRVLVRNPQEQELTIASVTVDDAIVPYSLDGPRTLERLRSSTVVIPYDWVPDEPISVGVTSSTGSRRPRRYLPRWRRRSPRRAASSATGSSASSSAWCRSPSASPCCLRSGVPTRVGSPRSWRLPRASLALAVEALSEAFAAQAALPEPIGGAGLVLLGVASSYLLMTFLARRLGGSTGATGLALAALVAIGIGVHNLGEGLAIGASFAIGELTLGSFLIVRFMIHNITEGLGIAAPAAEEQPGDVRPARPWRSSPAGLRSLAPGSAAMRRPTC